MTKLKDFMVAAGWTQDEFDTGNDRMSLHKSTVFVQMHWDNTDDIGLWQSLAYTGGNLPGDHPNDSGNIAAATGAITTGRRLNTLTNGPFINHHFFASGNYVYAALQISTGIWRFFGFGILTKLGNWVGGEFAFGTFWNNSNVNTQSFGGHSLVFDVATTDNTVAGCMHVEGLPGQGGTGKWGVFCDSATPGNDDAAVVRVPLIGGSRGGIYPNGVGYFQLSALNGFVPMMPVPAFYHRRATSPQHIYPLGFLPDFKQLNIGRYVPEQEIVVGGDTWIIFPMTNKIFDGTITGVPQSGNAGYAIKKVP